MARQFCRLSELAIKQFSEKGLYPDGGGLYLKVSPTGKKSWIFRYRINGRKTPRDMGLGSFRSISLSHARVRASLAREKVSSGMDPIEEKRDTKTLNKMVSAKPFSYYAATYIESQKSGWSSQKYLKQWESSLEKYVYPVFGSVPVGEVDTALVREALEPIWNDVTETANRIRSRIELIIDYAEATGCSVQRNPARWRGNLELYLDSPAKFRLKKHHSSLPYRKTPRFIKNLQSYKCVTALALEWLILTVSRPRETLMADWDSVDFDNHIWTIKSGRSQKYNQNVIPLSKKALEIAIKMKKISAGQYIFSREKSNLPLSSNAMLSLITRMSESEKSTPNGFRATFKEWALNQTSFHIDLINVTLAKKISYKTEIFQREVDFFNKRRILMNDWSRHCTEAYYAPSSSFGGLNNS